MALVIALKGFKGLLGTQIQPGRRFGSELSDYAKVMGVKGLFHSDELPNYGITQDEKDSIARKLKLEADDALVLIIEGKKVATRAMEAVIDRLSDLHLRKEVRVARPDASSSYMRPMPGAARMYPETDVDPVLVDDSSIIVPQLLSERISELAQKLSLSEDIAKKLIRDGINLLDLYETYPDMKPSFMIDILYSLPSIVKKKHDIEVDMTPHLDVILSKLQAGEITKESLENIALDLGKGTVNWEKYKPLDISDIEEELRALIKPIKDKPMGAIMGSVMGQFKGKIDGKQLSALVMKLVKE